VSKCDPVPALSFEPVPVKSGSGADAEMEKNGYEMNVVKDDPLRDTPEKAKRYYQVLAQIMAADARDAMRGASPDDVAAAAELLGA